MVMPRVEPMPIGNNFAPIRLIVNDFAHVIDAPPVIL